MSLGRALRIPPTTVSYAHKGENQGCQQPNVYISWFSLLGVHYETVGSLHMESQRWVTFGVTSGQENHLHY